MFDTELINEILSQILTAAYRIERRSQDIFEPDDFLVSDAGIDKLGGLKSNGTKTYAKAKCTLSSLAHIST